MIFLGLFSGWAESDTLDQFSSIPDLFHRSISHCHCWYLSYRGRWWNLASRFRWKTSASTRVIFTPLIKYILSFRICSPEHQLFWSIQMVLIFYSFTLDIMTRSTFWNITINGFILWISQIGFSQNNIQRITSLPTLESARRFLFKSNISFPINNRWTGFIAETG